MSLVDLFRVQVFTLSALSHGLCVIDLLENRNSSRVNENN